MDVHAATQIAGEWLGQHNCCDFPVALFLRETIERDFGWVFFYGPADWSIIVAGNAPLIVDRREGTIHVTGTAFPIEQYLESYGRVGRTYPFAVAIHLVILEGWKPGMLKVQLTKLIRANAGKGLAEAKRCTDEVLAGKAVVPTFASAADADAFCADAQQLGVVSKRKTRFQ
jgi:hypothetical protein